LHGGHVAVVEGVRCARENLEHAQRFAEMAQGRGQYGARTKTAAARQIDARVSLGIVTKDHLAGADTIGGNSSVGLQANSEVWRGSSSAGAADDFAGTVKRSCSL